jgi:RND family efflux transporter MFP subunit
VSDPKATSPAQPHGELNIPPLHKANRVRQVLVGVALLAAASGLVAYYTREEAPTELFRTVPMATRDIVEVVSATGRLEVTSRTDVPAPAPGRLVSIAVSAGDSVVAGQLLCELDARAAELALRSARVAEEAAGGTVTQAKTLLDTAQYALNRARTLLEQGLGSPEDVRRAEREVAQAKATLDAARGEQKLAGQSVASAQLGQSLLRIVSPKTGIVLRAPERVGAAVSPDQPALFVIGDALDTMRVDAQVSEVDVGQVKPGQPAQVFVSAYPGRSYAGQVLRLGVEAERRDGAVLYPLRVEVKNPDGTLLPGMSARVELEVARAQNARSVHEAALRFVPEGVEPAAARSRIFVRKGPAELEAVQVRTLASDGVYAQVELVEPSTLPNDAQIAVGLTGGKSQTPKVSLGGKK